MIETKLVEFRWGDATCRVMASKLSTDLDSERRLLFGFEPGQIAVALLTFHEWHDAPAKWLRGSLIGSGHAYLVEHWDEVRSGETIDVVITERARA